MNTFIGIVIAFISYLAASQLWEIYKREKLLRGLIRDHLKIMDALESDNFMNEESALGHQICKPSEGVPYKLKIGILEQSDKSSTRRTLLIWTVVWIGLLYTLFQMGFGLFVFAAVLAMLGGAKTLSASGTRSALLHFRMLLKTFVDWHSNDKASLDRWMDENMGFEEGKYEAMVHIVGLPPEGRHPFAEKGL